MIIVVEGKGVGAGKSYFAVRYAIRHWCDGGTVFASASLRFKWEEIKRLVAVRYGWELQDDQYRTLSAENIAQLHEFTAGGDDSLNVLIIVDEAQDQLNARDWNDKSKRALFDWACQSRHDNNDLMFVTQAAANIDKQVRRLATFYYSVRNLSNFPLAGLGKIGSLAKFFTLGLHHGILFVQAQLDNDGRTVLERKLVSGDRGFFACYESKSMRATRKRLGEPISRKTLARAKTHKPMTKFIILAAVALLIYGGCQISKHGLLPSAGAKSAGVGSSPAPENKLAAIAAPTVQPYEVRQEKLKYCGGDCSGTIQLESGWFTEGEMSNAGMVERVRHGIIRVKKPNGELLYIVASH